jgi:hypothetical protein
MAAMRTVGVVVVGTAVWLGLAAVASGQARVVVPVVVTPGPTVSVPKSGKPAPAPAGPQTIDIRIREGGAATVERGIPGRPTGSTGVTVTIRGAGEGTVERGVPGRAGQGSAVRVIVKDGVPVETPIVVVPK